MRSLYVLFSSWQAKETLEFSGTKDPKSVYGEAVQKYGISFQSCSLKLVPGFYDCNLHLLSEAVFDCMYFGAQPQVTSLDARHLAA